jgi:hypothetical protein
VVVGWLPAFPAADSWPSRGQNHVFLEHEPACARFFEELRLFLSG